jgi:MtN3 and saliva related transmembrane protein
MDSSDLTGFAAATFTTVAFVPQVWRSYRTRDVSGISLGMYALFSAGVALWIVYGLLIGSWPLLVANCATFALASCVLAMKIASLVGPRRPEQQ